MSVGYGRNAPPPAPREPTKVETSLIELFGARSKILRRFDRASLADLKRLAALLTNATDGDLRRALAYLEALAEWPDPASSSADGQLE